MRSIVALSLALLLALAIALGLAPASQAQSLAEPSVTLKVMSFNIWYGGQQVNRGGIVDAIRASGADIVGLQEPDGGDFEIAAALGWEHVDERHHIISRYPIYEPADPAAPYVWIEVLPGAFVAMANTHLPSTPYGPEAVRDGMGLEKLLALENDTRLWALEPYLAALPPLIDAGVPLFFTGDFNTPSHLDWTLPMSKSRAAVAYPVEWPVTKALEAIGFRDSYREAHPDPVAKPGLTWTPGYPHPWVRETETHDRIDYVFAAGAALTFASEIVGEAGNVDVEIVAMPFPSDHRGVVSSFTVTPVGQPAMIAVERRRAPLGADILVRFHTAGAEDARVLAVPRGGDPAGEVVAAMSAGDRSDRPSIRWSTALWQAGAYDAVLTTPEGQELARAPFWVTADERVQFELDKQVYAPGEPILAQWRNAPGFKLDWIGLYEAGDPDVYNYYGFLYTGALVEGAMTIDEAALGLVLEPGDYEFRLMRDDGYMTLAIAPFTIAAP